MADAQLGWLQLINGTGLGRVGPRREPIALQRGDGLGFGGGSGDGDLEVFEAGPQGADLLLFELG
jgi:hypothetical protein